MSRPRAHIAGVGETRYTRWGKIGDVSEHALACEAIARAVADAGLSLDDVDPDQLAIGLPVELVWEDMSEDLAIPRFRPTGRQDAP